MVNKKRANKKNRMNNLRKTTTAERVSLKENEVSLPPATNLPVKEEIQNQAAYEKLPIVIDKTKEDLDLENVQEEVTENIKEEKTSALKKEINDIGLELVTNKKKLATEKAEGKIKGGRKKKLLKSRQIRSQTKNQVEPITSQDSQTTKPENVETKSVPTKLVKSLESKPEAKKPSEINKKNLISKPNHETESEPIIPDCFEFYEEYLPKEVIKSSIDKDYKDSNQLVFDYMNDKLPTSTNHNFIDPDLEFVAENPPNSESESWLGFSSESSDDINIILPTLRFVASTNSCGSCNLTMVSGPEVVFDENHEPKLTNLVFPDKTRKQMEDKVVENDGETKLVNAEEQKIEKSGSLPLQFDELLFMFEYSLEKLHSVMSTDKAMCENIATNSALGALSRMVLGGMEPKVASGKTIEKETNKSNAENEASVPLEEVMSFNNTNSSPEKNESNKNLSTEEKFEESQENPSKDETKPVSLINNFQHESIQESVKDTPKKEQPIEYVASETKFENQNSTESTNIKRTNVRALSSKGRSSRSRGRGGLNRTNKTSEIALKNEDFEQSTLMTTSSRGRSSRGRSKRGRGRGFSRRRGGLNDRKEESKENASTNSKNTDTFKESNCTQTSPAKTDSSTLISHQNCDTNQECSNQAIENKTSEIPLENEDFEQSTLMTSSSRGRPSRGRPKRGRGRGFSRLRGGLNDRNEDSKENASTNSKNADTFKESNCTQTSPAKTDSSTLISHQNGDTNQECANQSTEELATGLENNDFEGSTNSRSRLLKGRGGQRSSPKTLGPTFVTVPTTTYLQLRKRVDKEPLFRVTYGHVMINIYSIDELCNVNQYYEDYLKETF